MRASAVLGQCHSGHSNHLRGEYYFDRQTPSSRTDRHIIICLAEEHGAASVGESLTIAGVLTWEEGVPVLADCELYARTSRPAPRCSLAQSQRSRGWGRSKDGFSRRILSWTVSRGLPARHSIFGRFWSALKPVLGLCA